MQEIGVLKIADFGLSKTMPQAHADSSDDAYKMTGETGTYRYMVTSPPDWGGSRPSVSHPQGCRARQAPEVFRHEQYSSKVDVYAFAMVCFELFEGRYAFDGCDGISAAKSAAFQNHRPIMLRLDKPKVRTDRPRP